MGVCKGRGDREWAGSSSARRVSRKALIGAVAVVLAGGAVSTVAAQESTETTRAAQEKAATVVPRLFQGLDLTDDQASAVQVALEEHAATQPRELWEAAAEIREVLDPEQIAVLEERLSERPIAPRAGRGRTGGPPGRPGHRARSPYGGRGPGVRAEMGLRLESLQGLDLSDEQRAELKEIRETFGPRMREVWSEVRDGSLSRDEADARLEEVRASVHAAVLQVLTPEQQAQLEEHRAAAEARREAAEAQREARRDSARTRLQAWAQTQRQAMIDVLDLSEGQIAALDSLRADAWGPAGAPSWEGDRPSPDEMAAMREARHEDLTRILDDGQRETWIVHAALVRTEMRRRAGGRGFREPAPRRTSRPGR